MPNAEERYPGPDWETYKTLDVHTGGEPLRILLEGVPPIPGDTILAKRRRAKKHFDSVRTALMWEPRGHADMYGAILTDPVTPDGDLGVLFLHNEGFSTMCGHGVIALATALLEVGALKKEGDAPEIRMDTPAGRVTAIAHREGVRVRNVCFRNVPSFVYAFDRTVDVRGIGKVRYDVAYGGAFYAFVRAEDLGLMLEPDEFLRLVDLGMRIKQAVAANDPIEHPGEKDLGFLYGTVFVGPPRNQEHHSRNVCIFAGGEVDRSPTGTGVSARCALLYARGEIALDEPFIVESIVDTCMTGRVVEETSVGPHEAVIPEVLGSAHLVGRSEWWIDPKDPLRDGFILR